MIKIIRIAAVLLLALLLAAVTSAQVKKTQRPVDSDAGCNSDSGSR